MIARGICHGVDVKVVGEVAVVVDEIAEVVAGGCLRGLHSRKVFR